MLKKFTDWLLTPIRALFEWLNEFVAWLFEFITSLPAKVFDWLADGIIAFFNHIPVPSFFYDIGSAFSAVPSEVWFFAGCLNLSYGLGVVFSAYLLRFVLRRIPFIG